MFDGEGEPIVNSSHGYAWFLRDILFVPAFSPLYVLDQPIIVASVCIPDDVIKCNQLLEL